MERLFPLIILPGDLAIENATLFEIADYAYNAIGDFSTFTLKADGKPFYVTKANGNALSGNVTDVATVTNIFTVEGKGLDFTKLKVLIWLVNLKLI